MHRALFSHHCFCKVDLGGDGKVMGDLFIYCSLYPMLRELSGFDGEIERFAFILLFNLG